MTVRPLFTVRLAGGTYSDGVNDQGYRLRVLRVVVNGMTLDSIAKGSSLCELTSDGTTTCSWPEGWPAVPVPPDGLRSIAVDLDVGYYTVPWYLAHEWHDPAYAAGTFTWGTPEPVQAPASPVTP